MRKPNATDRCIECSDVIHYAGTPFCKACAQAFYKADKPAANHVNTGDVGDNNVN